MKETNCLRVVAVADTHTYEHDLVVPDGDIFVHAGDLLRAGTLEELRPVAQWIRELPHAHKVVTAGNHDWCFQREIARARAMLGEEVHYLQDSGVSIEGVQFWGTPWQPEFMGWAFNLPRGAALAEKWALIPDGTDVLVTHGPPFGFGDETFDGRHEGCRELRTALGRVRPLLHVFGHIHESGGLWRAEESVIVSNVTTVEGDRAPSVFDIDLVTGHVEIVSVPPGIERSL